MAETIPRSSTTPTALYVQELAAEQGVQAQRTRGDAWAEAITRMAGDEVNSDPTDDLLVALCRSRAITPQEMTRLVMAHHRECRQQGLTPQSPSPSKN